MGDDEAPLVEKIIFQVAGKEKRAGQKAIEKLDRRATRIRAARFETQVNRESRGSVDKC